MRKLLVTLICVCALMPFGAFGQALIIDHNCTDISKIQPQQIEKAKAEFKVAYGHTSHGSQVVAGMSAMAKANPELFAFGRNGGPRTLSLFDNTPPGDLGNPDRTTWAERTRSFLKNEGRDRNLIMWSWCGQVGSASEQDIKTYLGLMAALEKEFPKVKFVYMTGHLDGSGQTGNLNRRNEQIRDFCRSNGKILFDFADIESYAPGGKINYMELFANDSCDYKGGNWAEEFLSSNPAYKIDLPNDAAHTRPLNGALKGRAFWWMLAKLAAPGSSR